MPWAKNFGIFRISAKFTQETNNEYDMIYERKFTDTKYLSSKVLQRNFPFIYLDKMLWLFESFCRQNFFNKIMLLIQDKRSFLF